MATLSDVGDNVRKETHSALIKDRAGPAGSELTKALKARRVSEPLPQRKDFIDVELLVANVQETMNIRTPRRAAGSIRVGLKESL